ncbi:baseplate J/gp47 family protein [Moritella sp. 5]|uniref:baseplate J/gp47 family protein n=1 Tax=Moritella sp. 5 TaxID=2746231 RepID=UPI001BA9587E|nr:baseplate J/gp47 family protein [Moritella sp. 5]QUM81663.1 baseplate J/gp47 family protein [Moritella sp. 5]
MSKRPDIDFEALIAAEGIPTTEEALAIELQKEVEAAGSKVSNDSRMSPFWRLVQAVVIKPAMWIINNLLANHVLPNAFAATATGIYLELKAWDVDLERKQATHTRGLVEFFKEKPENPVVVNKGAIIETDSIDGIRYRLAVVDDVVIAQGKESGLVLCEAFGSGAAFNLPAGYYSILPEGVSGITHASNPIDWIVSPGSNTEGDDELALRIRNQFSAAGRYHIDSIYRSMIASVASIRSDLIYFEHEAPRGPGTANAYILMEVGSTPSLLLEQLNHYVMDEGNHGHGDNVLCLAMPETQHQVSVVIYPVANLNDEQKSALKTEVENHINAAFRNIGDYAHVTRVDPKSTFSFSVLTKEMHIKLADLARLSFANQDITSALAIPRLSSVQVTYGA